MKLRRMTVMMVLVIFALSLVTGGLAMGMEAPRSSLNRFENGSMTLAGVSQGELQATVEATLVSHAGQTAGNFNFSVITKLVLLNNSSLNAADQSFIAGLLTRLTSLDLSGHVAKFTADFQNVRTITEVKLPANAVLMDNMFSGCDRLVRVLFLGENAPVIGANAFNGVTAVAYVTNPASGGFENPEFTALFSSVLTVGTPTFTTQPQSQTLVAGQDAVFTVAVTGTPSPTLQWQVSTNNGGTWVSIDGQTGITLRLNSVNQNQSGNQYRSIATNLAGEVVSSTATLTVNAVTITNAQPPRITNQPGNTTVAVNGNVTLSVTAEVSDGGTISYQWFSNSVDRNTGGTMIQGATGRTFTPSTAREGTTFYYVVVTNTNNNVNGTRTASVVSNTARVVVNPLVNAATPEITEQSEGVEVTITGRTVLFVNARAGDNGTLSYQWFRNDTDSNTGGVAISGATNPDFRPRTDTLGVVYYYVVVTNTNSSVNGEKVATVTSRAVRVAVITTPDAPMNLDTIIDGNTVTLTWEAPENDGGSEIIGYQVSDNIVLLWIDANGEYEHKFENLGFNREYTFKVRAVNAAGVSEEAELRATTDMAEVVEPEVEDEDYDNDDGYYVTEHNSDHDHLLLWIGLGTLAPLGTGTGVYFWRKKHRKTPKAWSSHKR